MSNPRPVRFVDFPRPGPREELDTFAPADPAAQSVLLAYEVRPWLTAMEHHRNEEP